MRKRAYGFGSGYSHQAPIGGFGFDDRAQRGLTPGPRGFLGPPQRFGGAHLSQPEEIPGPNYGAMAGYGRRGGGGSIWRPASGLASGPVLPPQGAVSGGELGDESNPAVQALLRRLKEKAKQEVMAEIAQQMGGKPTATPVANSQGSGGGMDATRMPQMAPPPAMPQLGQQSPRVPPVPRQESQRPAGVYGEAFGADRPRSSVFVAPPTNAPPEPATSSGELGEAQGIRPYVQVAGKSNNQESGGNEAASDEEEAADSGAGNTEQVHKAMEIEIGVPKDMMTPEHCKLCDAQLTGSESARLHYAGKRHAQKENQYIRKIYQEMGIDPTRFLIKPQGGEAPQPKKKASKVDTSKFKYTCFLCNVSFETYEQVEAHVLTRQHVAKIKQYEQHMAMTGGAPPPKRMKPGQREYVCHLCDKVMNSPDQYDLHITSKKHLAKERLLAEQREVAGQGWGDDETGSEPYWRGESDEGGLAGYGQPFSYYDY